MDCHMGAIWMPYGCHIDAIWHQYGCHMDAIWMGIHMASIWTFIWHPYSYPGNVLCLACKAWDQQWRHLIHRGNLKHLQLLKRNDSRNSCRTRYNTGVDEEHQQ